jgi:hypothetical protein
MQAAQSALMNVIPVHHLLHASPASPKKLYRILHQTGAVVFQVIIPQGF